jgi:hypothetical protein
MYNSPKCESGDAIQSAKKQNKTMDDDPHSGLEYLGLLALG